MYSHVRRSPSTTALVTSAYSNHKEPTSFKHSRSAADLLLSQSVSHDFDPLPRQNILAPVSAYLSTGTSLNVPEPSVKDGLLKRAINDPIVHGKSLNAERSAVSALPTSRKYPEPVTDTNLQNQCALPAIPSVIPDSRSSANVSAAISVIDDHSHIARPIAFIPNALSLRDVHCCLKTLERQIPRCVLPLAGPSRSPPAQAKPTSASQPSLSASSFLAPDSSTLTNQVFQFKEQQLIPTASSYAPGKQSPSVKTTSSSHSTPPQLMVQKPASSSFTAFLPAMLHPSALPLSDLQTSLPLIQVTPVAAPFPLESSPSNLQLPSSDDSSSGGSSNRSESI